jgi:hypothetical protein
MMKNLYTALSSIALTLWVGGLIAIGYLAVPILFSAQPDKQLAGKLAGEMFHALGYMGIVCGLIVLTHTLWLEQKGKQRNKALWLVGAMLIMSLIIQLGISPQMAELKQLALPEDVLHSIYAEKFKALHGVSSILYLAESLLGLYLIALRTNKSNLLSNGST